MNYTKIVAKQIHEERCNIIKHQEHANKNHIEELGRLLSRWLTCTSIPEFGFKHHVKKIPKYVGYRDR